MDAALVHLVHQVAFGGVAAAGFAVLFNVGPRTLLWCAAAGALALLVRTLGQDAGWSLEAASFVAAIAASLLPGPSAASSARPATRWRSPAAFPWCPARS